MSNTTTTGDDPHQLVKAYRHDIHKLTGEAHQNASETFAGVSVNHSVPRGADSDAAAMSRPSGEPTQTVDAHGSHYRLSLVTGESSFDTGTGERLASAKTVSDLVSKTDPEAMHWAWLTSDTASGFNETVYYPYTSLKYHTLLVAALLDNYRANHEFEDLLLIVNSADEIVPHRTIYAGDRFGLRIDTNHDEAPWARLGNWPRRSWATTWSRLSGHPLNTDTDKFDRVLDANLRRLRSWSAALQYIEDFERWGERP